MKLLLLSAVGQLPGQIVDLELAGGARIRRPGSEWLEVRRPEPIPSGTMVQLGHAVFRHGGDDEDPVVTAELQLAVRSRDWLSGALSTKPFNDLARRDGGPIGLYCLGKQGRDPYLLAAVIARMRDRLDSGAIIGVADDRFAILGAEVGRETLRFEDARWAGDDWEVRASPITTEELDIYFPASHPGPPIPPRCRECGGALFHVDELPGPTLGCRGCGGMFDLDPSIRWGDRP